MKIRTSDTCDSPAVRAVQVAATSSRACCAAVRRGAQVDGRDAQGREADRCLPEPGGQELEDRRLLAQLQRDDGGPRQLQQWAWWKSSEILLWVAASMGEG